MIITIDGNATLCDGYDGSLLKVTAASVITIPLDSNHLFLPQDTTNIFSVTTGTVSLAVESGVSLCAKGTTLNGQFSYCSLEKIGTNDWIAWGDLV